jgi:hypothetical protein
MQWRPPMHIMRIVTFLLCFMSCMQGSGLRQCGGILEVWQTGTECTKLQSLGRCVMVWQATQPVRIRLVRHVRRCCTIQSPALGATQRRVETPSTWQPHGRCPS